MESFIKNESVTATQRAFREHFGLGRHFGRHLVDTLVDTLGLVDLIPYLFEPRFYHGLLTSEILDPH